MAKGKRGDKSKANGANLGLKEKMEWLTGRLAEHFEQAGALQGVIRSKLKGLGYGI